MRKQVSDNLSCRDNLACIVMQILGSQSVGIFINVIILFITMYLFH
jgi:hypothetical protein